LWAVRTTVRVHVVFAGVRVCVYAVYCMLLSILRNKWSDDNNDGAWELKMNGSLAFIMRARCGHVTVKAWPVR